MVIDAEILYAAGHSSNKELERCCFLEVLR